MDYGKTRGKVICHLFYFLLFL